MLVALWGAKGGVGTSVTTATLGVCLARDIGPTRIVDLGGDQAALLGLPSTPAVGLAELVAAADGAGSEGVARLATDVSDQLTLLGGGAASIPPARDLAARIAELFEGSIVVVDLGGCRGDLAHVVREIADCRCLVVRSCYLALRRGVFDRASDGADALVLVEEPGRAIQRRDVEHVFARSVTARIPVRPGIARAIDAGVLATRTPEPLVRAVGPLVDLVRSANLVPRDG